jgi:hypothetical protein
VCWAAAQALKELAIEEDLDWWAEQIAGQPWAGYTAEADKVLIHVDRKLYLWSRLGAPT